MKHLLIPIVILTALVFTVLGQAKAQTLPKTLPVVTFTSGIAHIHVAMPGTWSVERGYVTTRPDGTKLACELGFWDESIPQGVSVLECVEFKDTKTYLGHTDGRLELKL